MRNQNRTAEVAAELVEPQLGDCAGGIERAAGIESVVAQELISGAVERAAAALGVDGDHDARVAAVFGVEGAGLQLEFADRVQADLRVLAVIRAHVGVDGAVQKHVVAAAALAVDVERVRVVERQPEIAGVVRDDARKRAHQRLEVAPVEREFRSLPCELMTNDFCDGGGFDQRDLRFDRDRFGDLPDLQRQRRPGS